MVKEDGRLNEVIEREKYFEKLRPWPWIRQNQKLLIFSRTEANFNVKILDPIVMQRLV